MNRQAITAVRYPGTMQCAGRIRFLCEGKWLRMRLPSGRCLWYSQPLIETDKYDGEMVTYMGVNPKTKKWERGQTYGGRLTENAVQGLCRDLLVSGMRRLSIQATGPSTSCTTRSTASRRRSGGRSARCARSCATARRGRRGSRCRQTAAGACVIQNRGAR